MRAVDFGQNVCLIEASHLGGAGIMNGALTSKTMYELSLDYSVASRIDRGYRVSSLVVDFNEVKKTVIHAAKEKQYQMLSQIETFAPHRRPQGSISLLKGWAKFLSPYEMEVKNAHDTLCINGKFFILATGCTPRKYPDLETDGHRIITSDEILSLTTFPQRMLIIGSGIIGTEFATIFSNFRQTEVHLLDRAHKVMPFEDDDLSNFISQNLEENGVLIHHTAKLRHIRKHADHLEVVLDYEDGHSKVIEVDVAFIAIGREPNTSHLNLKLAGIVPTEKGTLAVNDYCVVSNTLGLSHIYAIGDITGHTQLYSVAEFQGRLAAEHIHNQVSCPPEYDHMSTLMFFKPEVAAVGANEKMLQKKGIAYRSAFYSNKLINRAIAMRNTSGFVKILVSADTEQRILGMRAAGPQASSFIVSVAHLINQGNSIREVLRIFYPHPSIPEGVQECLRALSGKSIYKPEAFPDYIRISEWKPKSPDPNTP